MADDEVTLECRGLSRRYDDKNHPLKSITLTALRGEFLAITGPSGAGKSTLLNILGMLDRADSGEYLVGGVHVSTLSDRERDTFRGHVFGFVFQASHLIAGRTVAQNLDVALQYSAVPPDARPEVIVGALRSVGLLHKLNSQVQALSGGERQRVAIARALVHSPSVLFMDEPTGNLDDDNTETVVSLIERLSQQGLTVVVVTHDDRVSARAVRQLRLADGTLTETRASVGGVSSAAADLSARSRKRVAFSKIAADAVFGLTSRALRAWIAIAIVALGTSGLVIATGLSATASRQVDDSIRSASGSTVRATFDLEHDRTRSPDALKDLRTIASLDGVTGASLRWDIAELAGAVTRIGDQHQDDLRRNVRVIAVAGDFFSVAAATAMPGNSGRILVGPDNVSFGATVLGSTAARSLGVAGASPGTTIWIGSQRLSVIGILEPTAPGAENLDDAILVGFATGAVVATSVPVGQFVVSTEPGMAPELARVVPIALQPAHPEWIEVETAAQLGELRSAVNSQFEQLVTAVAGVLIVLAVLVTTAITMAGVNGRRFEIALRRAIGATKSEVGALFTLENALIGVVGGLLGVAVGEIVVLVGSRLLGWTPAIPIGVLVFGPLVGLAVAALAAVAPALRSASIQPSLELHSA